MKIRRILFFFAFVLLATTCYAQQDVNLYVTRHLLPGKKIIKVYKNTPSELVWVLTDNNQIFRINTTTEAVDDLSATFAPYAGYRFIDIVAHKDQEIYVATDDEFVIRLRNGVLDIIGAQQGLRGKINSIGLFLNNSALEYGIYDYLRIGTSVGMANYFIDEARLDFYQDTQPSHVYESNHRTGMYAFSKGSIIDDKPDQLIGVTVWFYQGHVGTYLLHGGEYGPVLNGFYDFPDNSQEINVKHELLNLYSGTPNGLFRNFLDHGYLADQVTHYLDGIQVNKVNNILGLTAFGANVFKANLLVGTEQGLYFSNSTISHNYLPTDLTFTHLDQLGNLRINDIETSIAYQASRYYYVDCEDGAWLGTDDGLYFIKPDYAAYFNVKSIKGISFEGQSDNLEEIVSCEPSEKAILDITLAAGNSIQWFKNSIPINGANSSSLLMTDAGDYYALLFNSCENLHVETNHLKLTRPAPVFTFDYPDKVPFCDVASTTLKVVASDEYNYRWYRNGVLTGETSDRAVITESGTYKAEVSTCPGTWLPTKEVVVDLINLPLPVLSANKAQYCEGEKAMLNSRVAEDAAYDITWYKNGVQVPAFNGKAKVEVSDAGTYLVKVISRIASCFKNSGEKQIAFIPAPVIAFNYTDELNYCENEKASLIVSGNAAYTYRWYKDGNLLNNQTGLQLEVNQTGSYKVEVSSCPGSWVPSKNVKVNFIKLPVPVIATDKPSYCAGDVAAIASGVPLDASYTINWFKDGQPLSSYENIAAIKAETPGNYAVIITSKKANCSTALVEKQISFKAVPRIVITKATTSTLCSGQPVTLTASYTGGEILWASGEKTAAIEVTRSGKYSAIVRSSSGCLAQAFIDLQFFPTPALNVPNAKLCEFATESVNLTAPAGFAKYKWNGIEGAATYQVNKPQTVTLTVTDGNGCEATQQIVIAAYCQGSEMVNTFTPNGDGVNDTWNVAGAGADQHSKINIFNRYGKLAYHSVGYTAPWDGKYQGKPLPAGTYYYVITSSDDKNKLSGFVVILY
jgi:gliding motility-associated-like protein